MEYRYRIAAKKKELSNSHRIICDYILREYVTAAMSTVEEIAKECNTHPTSVVRCAQALGYSGWPELQEQLKSHALLDFKNSNGPGRQNYIDALVAWVNYVSCLQSSIQTPENPDFAVNAATAYQEAISLTQYCLNGKNL